MPVISVLKLVSGNNYKNALMSGIITVSKLRLTWNNAHVLWRWELKLLRWIGSCKDILQNAVQRLFGVTKSSQRTGLWRRSLSNFGRLEPETNIFRWWSQAWNTGSGSTEIVCGASEIYKQYNAFSDFWTKLFWSRNQKFLDVGAGAPFRCPALELEPEIWVQAPQPCYWNCQEFCFFRYGNRIIRRLKR